MRSSTSLSLPLLTLPLLITASATPPTIISLLSNPLPLDASFSASCHSIFTTPLTACSSTLTCTPSCVSALSSLKKESLTFCPEFHNNPMVYQLQSGELLDFFCPKTAWVSEDSEQVKVNEDIPPISSTAESPSTTNSPPRYPLKSSTPAAVPISPTFSVVPSILTASSRTSSSAAPTISFSGFLTATLPAPPSSLNERRADDESITTTAGSATSLPTKLVVDTASSPSATLSASGMLNGILVDTRATPTAGSGNSGVREGVAGEGGLELAPQKSYVFGDAVATGGVGVKSEGGSGEGEVEQQSAEGGVKGMEGGMEWGILVGAVGVAVGIVIA